MDNTMKLLRAFIEASGFDVERVRDGSPFCDCNLRNNASKEPLSWCQTCHGTGFITHSVFDYKVTKKPLIKDVIIHGLPLTQYISNIIDLKQSAEKYRFIFYSRETIDAIIESGFFDVATKIDNGYLIEGVRVIYENV